MIEYIHIVLLKFKEDTSSAEIDDIFQKLKELQSENLIPGIVDYSYGAYDSPEGINKGFTHAFTMKFDSLESRNDYFPHQEHERVKAIILKKIDDVLAFDYPVK